MFLRSALNIFLRSALNVFREPSLTHDHIKLALEFRLYFISPQHTSFFIVKKDISLCYGLGMDMVHQDFPFQSIREKEFQKRIKGMANSWFRRLLFVT